MISSRTEPDDAASPPLSVDDVDRARVRPRLQRITRKKSTENTSSAPLAVNRSAPMETVSELPKSGLTRVTRRTDSTSEQRRKKLAKLREEFALRNAEDNSNGPALADRVTDAIRKSSSNEKPRSQQTRKKKSRKGVGWVLDAKVVKETLDARVAQGSNSSDAQAVTAEALRAELELRQMLAFSTANFQLDACPNVPVSEFPQPNKAPQAADVRPVAAMPAEPPKPTSSARSTSAELPPSELDVDFTDAVQTAACSGLALVEPPPAPVESYGDWFKRVVVRNRWLTWFTTFYIHWAVLLLLAAIIVHGPDETAELLLNAAFATEVETSTAPFEVTVPVEEVEPVVEPVAESAPAEESLQELEEEQLDISDAVLSEIAPQGIAAAKESANSEASESNEAAAAVATQHVDRAPAVATRQGSFSVWTEPANPRPGDPYRIIIQVRLPEKTKKYLVTDLEGVVVGSDGYRKPIPGFATGELPIVDGYARLAVPIVSADKKVRDTVFIRSRLLRETQKLLIEF